MNELRFTVNGRTIVERDAAPTTTLLNYLRDQLGLTGTKEGCAEGDCGACTVVVIDPDAPEGPAFRAVNSCLVLLPMIQGREVFTVDGLRDADGSYHPVQQAMVRRLGSQCGYCTPGIVMSMFEACYRRDLDAPWKLDDQLCGNLCRCTGYRPIREAAQDVAGACPADRFARALASPAPTAMGLRYERGDQRYANPDSFDALWDTLDAWPDARIVVGGTDLSLEITKQFKHIPTLVSLEGLAELRQIERREEGWWIGAAAPLSDVEARVGAELAAVERMLRFFGARQIKHRGTVGGNLCTASPIGDMAPALISLGAAAQLRSRAGRRTLPLDDFFLAYRKTALAPGEILEGVFVPHLPAGDVRSTAYKVSKRQELDISAVSAGLYVALDPDGLVTAARLAFGGVAATPARARRAEQRLLGQPWTAEAVEAAAQRLDEDFTPISDHRGSAWYRQTVARNLLRGFYAETLREPTPRLSYRPTATVQVGPATH